MQDYDKAIQCFQEVVKLESDNHLALKQIQVCHQKIQQNLERGKELHANMFKCPTKRSAIH